MNYGDITNYLVERDSFREELKEHLRDKFIPIDIRWDMFVHSNDILPTNWYISDCTDILSDCLYDDFGIDRSQTLFFKDIVERVQDSITLEGEEPDRYSARFDEMFKKLPEFKEAVLQSGYSGFINDW